MTVIDDYGTMSAVVRPDDDRSAGREETIPAELVDQLMAKVHADGLELLGEGGVLAELTKRILERALDEELTVGLGYERGDRAGNGSGNSRNGTTPKRVLTEIGPVDVDVPRDRNGSFEPVTVPKGQRRLDGLSGNVISLYAKGLTTGDIRNHLAEIYDTDISPDTISRITDAVVEDLLAWQNRPLDRGQFLAVVANQLVSV